MSRATSKESLQERILGSGKIEETAAKNILSGDIPSQEASRQEMQDRITQGCIAYQKELEKAIAEAKETFSTWAYAEHDDPSAIGRKKVRMPSCVKFDRFFLLVQSHVLSYQELAEMKAKYPDHYVPPFRVIITRLLTPVIPILGSVLYRIWMTDLHDGDPIEIVWDLPGNDYIASGAHIDLPPTATTLRSIAAHRDGSLEAACLAEIEAITVSVERQCGMTDTVRQILCSKGEKKRKPRKR